MYVRASVNTPELRCYAEAECEEAAAAPCAQSLARSARELTLAQ